MKYGIREICDVVLKAKSNQKIGNKIFYKDEPVLYFDTLKSSTLEGAATTVYAQGGRGNSRLVAWEGERTVTFTMEDALISPTGFAILSGAGLVEADKNNTIKVHTTEVAEVSGFGEDYYIEEEVDLTKDFYDNNFYFRIYDCNSVSIKATISLDDLEIDPDRTDCFRLKDQMRYGYVNWFVGYLQDWDYSGEDENAHTIDFMPLKLYPEAETGCYIDYVNGVYVIDYEYQYPTGDDAQPDFFSENHSEKYHDFSFFQSFKAMAKIDRVQKTTKIELNKQPYGKRYTGNNINSGIIRQDSGNINEVPDNVWGNYNMPFKKDKTYTLLLNMDQEDIDLGYHVYLVDTYNGFYEEDKAKSMLIANGEIYLNNQKRYNSQKISDNQYQFTIKTPIPEDTNKDCQYCLAIVPDSYPLQSDYFMSFEFYEGTEPSYYYNISHTYAMQLKDNEMITEPYIPVRMTNNAIELNMSRDDLDDVKIGDQFLVDYYTEVASGAQQIEITPDKFGGNYYLEATTLFRNQDGTDVPASFIIPNCKIQSNFNFTMASSGDPSTFTFTMDAFPDYLRFDKSKKVLAAIQLINDNKLDGSTTRDRTKSNIKLK